MISLDILIPAHNEELFIQETLISLKNVFEKASAHFNFKYQIYVGCNGCTDQTVALARPLVAEVFEWPAMGKWKALEKLTQRSSADFILFVDAGAVWPNDAFQTGLWKQLNEPDSMGLALSYNPLGLGVIEKTYWSVEAFFKSLEIKLGGLVAVSGVSVFYRTQFAQAAFRFLNEKFPQTQWLNDDVILPATMRFLEPMKKIDLGHLQKNILDAGLAKSASEKSRRERMMRGNIQWMRLLIPLFFDKKFITLNRMKVFLILSRRILKVFWAYFVLGILAILIYFFFEPMYILIGGGLLALALLYNPQTFKKIIFSLLASLRAPLDLIFWSEQRSTWS
ncbi:MAG: glycosyltransferase [Bdellovibrio sp.]|nr:glycosyltransferase [Bdellovibrio sp.]